jgi:predicted enzyme related to lactoylglutathione lyase
VTTNGDRGLGPIMQILVPVADVDRAVTFYEDGYAGPATLYFRVDDVTATFERLVARGATGREVPEVAHRDAEYDLWLAFVSDPEGNNIGLMREAPKGLERG